MALAGVVIEQTKRDLVKRGANGVDLSRTSMQ